jgi:hypothetical protein
MLHVRLKRVFHITDDPRVKIQSES